MVTKFNTSKFSSVVNNADFDPLQGYDADVWVLDQGTGSFNLMGRFTSIQLVVRNATEPYMEYNQRFPRHLDGDIQIGWVMERGMIDGRTFEQTFGLSVLSRELRVNRMPRFQITFAINAPELDNIGVEKGASINQSEISGLGGQDYSKRQAKNEIILTMCKIDTFTLGSTAGRQVIANRWEGMAEGIEVVRRASNDNPGISFNSLNLQDARDALAKASTGNNSSGTYFPWDKQVRSSIDSYSDATSNLFTEGLVDTTGGNDGVQGPNP